MVKNPVELREFVKGIAYFQKKYFVDKIVLFGYYLQKKEDSGYFTINDINECFTDAASQKPKNFTDLFVKLAHVGKIIEKNGGWILSGLEAERIEEEELGGLPMVSIKDELKSLPKKVPEVQQKFVNEILGCLQVQAWRGSIVLTWILIIDHLQQVVLSDYVKKFNEILNETKSYKDVTVNRIEDFEKIKDGDFLKTIRTCGMTTGSQYNILDTRLKERNRYAHPTNLEITDTIAVAFIEDLVNNILFKVKSENEK